MGTKIRIGMLCRFKEHHAGYWSARTDLPLGEERIPILSSRYKSQNFQFTSRLVTAIEKRGGLMNGKWVSFTKVLGKTEAGTARMGWVVSQMLKPVHESRRSQSKD